MSAAIRKTNTSSLLIRAVTRAEWKTHTRLLSQFDNMNCVYVCKLSSKSLPFIDGRHRGRLAAKSPSSFVLKIGSSQNVRQRLRNLAHHFNCRPVLLHVAECDMYKQFERFLHHQGLLRKYKYASLSRETYRVTDSIFTKRVLPVLSHHHERFRFSPAAQEALRIEQKRNQEEAPPPSAQARSPHSGVEQNGEFVATKQRTTEAKLNGRKRLVRSNQRSKSIDEGKEEDDEETRFLNDFLDDTATTVSDHRGQIGFTEETDDKLEILRSDHRAQARSTSRASALNTLRGGPLGVERERSKMLLDTNDFFSLSPPETSVHAACSTSRPQEVKQNMCVSVPFVGTTKSRQLKELGVIFGKRVTDCERLRRRSEDNNKKVV